MALDEDGRPVSGAGALPYQGISGGTGDTSGVAFTRNIMEKPPTPNPTGRFMTDFAKLIADVAAGNTEAADITDVSNGKPEDAAERRRAASRINIQKAQAARKAKLEAKKNGRAVAMPQSQVSERPERAEAGSAAVQGDDQGPGISSDGLSHLSRLGSGGGAGVSEVQQSAQAADPGLQSRIMQAAAQVGMQAFHVNPQMFAKIPLEQALHLLDTLRAQTSALSQMLEERRQNEQGEDLTKCMWCGKPYPNGHFFARTPFEIPVGSGQWHSVHSCANATCLGKFNQAVDKIQREIRVERN